MVTSKLLSGEAVGRSRIVLDDVAVREALSELNGDDRAALLARYVNNDTWAEVGSIYGVKEAQAKAKLEKITQKLRPLLE